MSRPVYLLIRSGETETSRRKYSAICDALWMFGDLVDRFPDRFAPGSGVRMSVVDAADNRKAQR